MFHGATSNNLINKVQYRTLRMIHNDYTASYKTLLKKNSSSTIHIDNLRALMTEVYKSLNKLNPSFMWEMFQIKNCKYALRSGINLEVVKKRTVTYGINSIHFKACMLWNNLPTYIKESVSLPIFKQKIKAWSGDSCNCKICRHVKIQY